MGADDKIRFRATLRYRRVGDRIYIVDLPGDPAFKIERVRRAPTEKGEADDG